MFPPGVGLAELDAQIEKKKASRKGQLQKLAQLFEDELGEGVGGGLDEDTIREVKQALQAKEEELTAERDRVARWLREAED